MKNSSRTQARTEAFKIIFQIPANGDGIQTGLAELEESAELKNNIEYIKRVSTGVLERNGELEELIQKHLGKGWTVSRLSRVSLAALKLAAYEMIYEQDIPEAVSINEAIELTKAYDEPERAAFVNGVLAGISKSLKD